MRLYFLLALILLSTSCVPNAGTNSLRKSTKENAQVVDNDKTNNGPSTSTPSGVPSTNSFEINGSLSLIAQFPSSTDLTYNLRGIQVDQFLKKISSDIQCMVIEFPESVENRFLIFALIPRNRFLNNSFDQLEKNYSFYPNGDQNQIFCQKSSIVSALNTRIPESKIAYRAIDICPNCVTSLFQASNVSIYSSNGIQLNDISLSLNSIRVENIVGDFQTGTQCKSKNECLIEGFDCCTIEGICADDLTIKNGVDQSSAEFQEVLRIVNLEPARRKDYPQYYNICPYDIPVDTELDNGETASDNLENDAKRLVHLADLYDCTREIEGEMSYCTTKIDDVSTLGTTIFQTGEDDRNFETTYSGRLILPKHSIIEVTYSGETLFKDNTFFSTDLKIGANNNLLGNDNLSDPGVIEMTKKKSANDNDDLLRIKYKIDGSCEPILGDLAQCTKYYIQGDNVGKVTDHFPATNEFILPRYADANRTIQIFVDDVPRFNGTHWTISKTNPTTIRFNGTTLQVFEGQSVKIKYFVDTSSNPVLQAKLDALNEIKQICKCADIKCRLRPTITEKNGKSVITDFACQYPPPDLPPAPLQQSVLLSSKTVPVRLFNEIGEEEIEANYNNLPQEGSEFKYIDRDVLKPNNVNDYIGFNEIYGSITPDNLSAKPAKTVRVDKGKVYDIFVESGTFSSCFNCGTDYFSNIARLFPQNFTTKGGGAFPRPGLTERKNSSGYRADEVIFGRACWLPVTMIPWSHRPDTNRQNQRMDRQQAQHFLFANGYQRDWYGFDYGSVIGSFNGITWFSIGNQRRIQASSTKLFLAVNSYFGDQTTESSFQIVVTEASTAAFSGSQVTNDFASDGAECQREHVCETDVDCITNLGWDYTCQDIGAIKSNWPDFDSLANEIPNTSREVSLKALFDQALGGSKRCVYRGKGALCSTNLQNINKEDVFLRTTTTGLLACTDNNYCQDFSIGSATKRFNNKIARFAASATVQNTSSKVTESELDTFGLGTRSIGRPYSFNGTESIPPVVSNNLTENDALAMCIPGRDPNSSTVESSNLTVPGEEENGDKILNIGLTPNDVDTPNAKYFTSCGITDPISQNRILFESSLLSTATDETNIKNIASSQAFSTNHLRIFESLLGEDITTPMVNRQVTELTLGRNRCLRAPNSPCHTDLDCAPNSYITNFTKRIATGQSAINDYELKFWQEKLICSQANQFGDLDYDHSLNRCCRETDKTVQIPTKSPDLTGSKLFDNKSAPGTDIELSDPKRYSRNVLTYRETESGSIPYLSSPELQICTENNPENCNGQSTGPVAFDNTLLNQWKTFHLQSSRTCCSQNWIRNFDSSNGGGHNWGPSKKQQIDKKNFQCYNWAAEVEIPTSDPNTTFFNCDFSDDPEDPDCPIRSLFPSDYEPILEVMERLELTGIPQIMINIQEGPSSKTMCSAFPIDHVSSTVCNGKPNGLTCDFDKRPPLMPGILNDEDDMKEDETIDGVIPEYANTTDKRYGFSAADMDNFNPIIKKVFSEDTISCCLPIGSELELSDDKNLCCSGFKDETGTVPRCALPDYTNLSVYFNRYVSSEAAGLDDSLFEEDTGYLKSPDSVIELACQLNACASNTVAFGIVVTPLAVEGFVGTNKLFPRFIDSNQLATETENSLAQLFEEGLRWNTQVYCFPQVDESEIDTDDNRLTIKSCLQ